MRKFLLSLPLFLLAFPFQLSAFAQTSWRIATGYPAENFHTRNVQQFAEELGAAGVKVEVHPNGSLFKQPDILGAVQEGKVEGGEFIMSGVTAKVPLFALDSIPFITDGYPQARLLWDLSRAHVERELKERGLVLLYTVPWPPQGLYSVKPLHGSRDLKHANFRVYNPATKRLAELLGANPVTVQVPELASAFASGKLTTMISSSVTGVDIEAWKHLKYYYDLKAWNPKNIVVVRQKSFDALDAKTRTALLAAAKRAEDRGWQASEEKDAEARNKLKAMGIQVIAHSPELRENLVTTSERLIRESLKGTGLAGAEIGISFQLEKNKLNGGAGPNRALAIK
jgi:TRAP-type C4-dicarboxylate transport system substrate-binding protein